MSTKKNLLTEKWAIKYAKIKKIDKQVILQLFNDNALNASAVKGELIRYDEAKIVATSDLNTTQAKRLLAKEYGVAFSYVNKIVYKHQDSDPSVKHCTSCNAEISRYRYKKNHGLCEDCVIKESGVSL